MLDAWREGGADRVDPVRFRFLQAMARRSAVLDGLARQLLDEKLAGHLNAYAQLLDANADVETDANPGAGPDAGPNAEPNTPPPAEPANDAPSTLAGLLAYLADPGPDAPDGEPDWNRDALGLRDAYPDVQMLEYFRAVWSRVSADRQVRQSQQQVHKNAGPLNSNQLVHRALSLMRELSPGYLQQFLSYTDALMWMEQIHAATAPAPKDAARGAAKKTSRAKAR
ncbi:DUF2894 domain-containing protein [Achromobacter spanius]|uniref:DUF2894 domain-containing protein n=2 Tax=Achromobacter spanius TaxID=217203 RepID=A0AA42LKJ0_9BURK|nr:DUF2894 domain-containing protein [Achromobacter spanius]MDH0735149.1 DUF2894 domain-containing protein [Achromobacter spanius]